MHWLIKFPELYSSIIFISNVSIGQAYSNNHCYCIILGYIILSSTDMIENHRIEKNVLPISDNQTLINQIFLSTTCKTTTVVKTVNNISNSSVQPSAVRLDTRLGYETLSEQNDIESFLKVNNEELSKQLVNDGVTIDGSGESMFK